MQLTIDQTDYSSAIDSGQPLKVVRRLNSPSELKVCLVADTPQFVVPAEGAHIVLAKADGSSVFTGYLTSVPEFEYLGWGEQGPVYRYALQAVSDDFLLDRKLGPTRAPFSGRPAGKLLKQRVADFAVALDTSAVADADPLPAYTWDAEMPWSKEAAEIALRARAAWRAHDGKLHFAPVGQTQHAIDEAAAGFSPEGLRLVSPTLTANDVIVLGEKPEPHAHVKDYFLGDGVTLAFTLSNTPFTRTRISFVDDEFRGSQLNPQYWAATPGSAISVSGGQLNVTGAATVCFVEQIEIGGALVLQHGEISFSGPSSGIIGGLYVGATPANCTGFSVAPAGAQSCITPVVNGSAAGTSITTQAGHHYALSTRLYASEAYRMEQTFHSSLHPAGAGRGGAQIPANVHLVLEVHDIDPANPGTFGAVSTVLFDGTLATFPAFCNYALLCGNNLQCSIPFTRLSQAEYIDVSSGISGQAPRTRLVGALSEGAECALGSYQLRFYPQYVQAPSEAIKATYRSSGHAVARMNAPNSIAALASGSDDGIRHAIHHLASPPARTSADCANAALAILDDSTQAAWTGQYEILSDFLPNGDVYPGDSVAVHVPSRAADFIATVREVEIQACDLAGERSRYKIAFANDAAHPGSSFMRPPPKCWQRPILPRGKRST